MENQPDPNSATPGHPFRYWLIRGFALLFAAGSFLACQPTKAGIQAPGSLAAAAEIGSELSLRTSIQASSSCSQAYFISAAWKCLRGESDKNRSHRLPDAGGQAR